MYSGLSNGKYARIHQLDHFFDKLEVKFGIKVIATNEPIDIDPDDPDVFMQRAFRYLIANEELLRIRKRTKQGMRHAQESGRYINRAPFGYINV
jgi:site-specific DNA recombinase